MTEQNIPAWYSEEAGFFGPDYLREYADFLTAEQTRREIDFLEQRVPLRPGTHILDLACGHGRHSIELARRGYDVTGQDINECFLGVARRDATVAGVSVRWLQGDMREIRADGDAFDVVLNLFTSFGYFEEDDENAHVLREVARVLRPSGTFVLDIINAVWVYRNFRDRNWRKHTDGLVILTQRESMGLLRGILRETRTRIDLGGGITSSFEHTLRLYTPSELARLLHDAGLRVREAYGDWQGSSLTWDTQRCILLAEPIPVL